MLGLIFGHIWPFLLLIVVSLAYQIKTVYFPRPAIGQYREYKGGKVVRLDKR